MDSTEVDVFAENVHQERLREADDPSAVERWTADETVREVLNKPEYNQAKKYLRHTAYEATPDGGGETSVVEATLTSGGYLARAGGVDPADSWAGEMTIWDAINSLPPRNGARSSPTRHLDHREAFPGRRKLLARQDAQAKK